MVFILIIYLPRLASFGTVNIETLIPGLYNIHDVASTQTCQVNRVYQASMLVRSRNYPVVSTAI